MDLLVSGKFKSGRLHFRTIILGVIIFLIYLYYIMNTAAVPIECLVIFKKFPASFENKTLFSE